MSEAIRLARYEMKFMFDWGAGTCVWSTNDAARKTYGYVVDLHRLPISSERIQALTKLCEWHDEALDWNYPPDPLLWSREECGAFLLDAKKEYGKLCKELGHEYSIVFLGDIL